MDFTGVVCPTRLGVRVLYLGWGCELGWVGCVRYFGIESTGPADSKLFEVLVFSPIFTAGSRLVLLEVRQFALWLLTDEGMVTAF